MSGRSETGPASGDRAPEGSPAPSRRPGDASVAPARAGACEKAASQGADTAGVAVGSDASGAVAIGPGLRPAEELAARIGQATPVPGGPDMARTIPLESGPELSAGDGGKVTDGQWPYPGPEAAGLKAALDLSGTVPEARPSPAAGHPGRAADADPQGTGRPAVREEAGVPFASRRTTAAGGAAPDGCDGGSGREGAILVESMASTSLEVRAALQRFCARAAGLGLSADACMALEIVLAEALNNIVEHSYREHPSGWIVAEAECVGGWVVCRLTDGGDAMPGGTPPSAGPDPADRAAGLPEGGFGWQMIRDLAHHVNYAREGEVNRLLFSLPVGSGPVTARKGDR